MTTTTRLKHVARLVRDIGDSNSARPYVALEHVQSDVGRLFSGVELPMRRGGEPGAMSVERGDVLFGKLRPYLAKSVLADKSLYASAEFLAIRAGDVLDPRYLFYVVLSKPFVTWAEATSDGTKMPRTNWNVLADIPVHLPERGTQRRVADFLDAETARIDALIDKKRYMIIVTERRFQSLANHAVLASLDPITGEGELPSGWRRARLGVAIALQRGFDLPYGDRRDGPIPVISSGGRSGAHNIAMCDGPGVVTGRYGTVGGVHFIEGPHWPLNTTLFVSDFRGNDPRWVFHLLRVVPLDIDAEKSAVTGINRNVVGALFVPLPPLDAQRKLATELDLEERRSIALADLLRRQIDLLREHRQALITAAVTGELDVSKAAA